MNKKFLGIFFFVYITLNFTKACTCEWDQSSLEVFCSADWVAHFKVIDVKPMINPDLLEYTIEYIKVFKMPSKFNETHPTKIYSYESESMCGMRLSENEKFLLVGRISPHLTDDGAPRDPIEVDHCTFLDEQFQRKLKKGMPTQCICNPWKDERNEIDGIDGRLFD